MTLDSMPIPTSLPSALHARCELARAIRRDPALTALSEGLTLLAAGIPFRDAFTTEEVVSRRIREASGEAGLQAYLAAVERLRQSLDDPQEE